MAHVVFTTISSLDDLPTAHWHKGDNDSYKNTKAGIKPVAGSIRLIGRQGRPGTGSVQLCYASFGNKDWEGISGWHVDLARFFFSKLEQRLATLPEGASLQPFIESMDDPKARHAAQQLVGLECGINVTKEPGGALHKAVQQVQAGLEALGVPCGDWTFTPLFDGFETI